MSRGYHKTQESAISRILEGLAYFAERGVSDSVEQSAWGITCFYLSQWLFEMARRANS